MISVENNCRNLILEIREIILKNTRNFTKSLFSWRSRQKMSSITEDAEIQVIHQVTDKNVCPVTTFEAFNKL